MTGAGDRPCGFYAYTGNRDGTDWQVERCILPPHHGTHHFPSGATCEHPTNTIRARIVVPGKESR